MSTSSEGHPDNYLDSVLQQRLRQLYAERFDVTQDGAAASHPPAVIPNEGGLRAWLRELAQADSRLDQRTLFSVTGLPLPLAPLPACPTLWDFKRSTRYRAEVMRDLHDNGSVTCNAPNDCRSMSIWSFAYPRRSWHSTRCVTCSMRPCHISVMPCRSPSATSMSRCV